MEKTILYQSNWCDYFTPCPHGKECCVGDYDCVTCEHFVKHILIGEMPSDIKNDYKRYFKIYNGQIICNSSKIY